MKRTCHRLSPYCTGTDFPPFEPEIIVITISYDDAVTLKTGIIGFGGMYPVNVLNGVVEPGVEN